MVFAELRSARRFRTRSRSSSSSGCATRIPDHAGAGWLDEHLAAQGHDGRRDRARRAPAAGAANVTVRNIITSMRLISDVDWAEFVRARQPRRRGARGRRRFADDGFPDPQPLPHAIEELARGSNRSELEVARRAVAGGWAEPHRAESSVADARRRDPGYYLIAGRAPGVRSERSASGRRCVLGCGAL